VSQPTKPNSVLVLNSAPLLARAFVVELLYGVPPGANPVRISVQPIEVINFTEEPTCSSSE